MTITNIRGTTLSGLNWSLMERVFTQGVNFLVNIILARLLDPDSFGLIAMIVVFTGLATVLSELGLTNSLIHRQDIEKEDLNTVFWTNLIFGGIFGVIFYMLAGQIGQFYGEKRVEALIEFSSCLFLLGGMSAVHRTLLRKEMKYKKLSIIVVLGTFISSVLGITAAFLDFSYWSLLIKIISFSIINTFLLWIFTGWFPEFSFSKDKLLLHFKFGVNITANSLMTYSSRNIDNIVIGKFLGSGALGIYGRAYALMTLPISNIGGIIRQVMFSSFSIIQNDLQRVRRIYLKATWVICFVTFPLVVLLSALSSPFVLVVFGKQWMEMVFPLKILALAAFPQLILLLNASIYQSLGRPDIPLKINSVWIPVLILTYILATLQFGLSGLVLALMILFYLATYPLFYFAGKMINLTFLNQLRNLVDVILLTILQYFVCNLINDTALDPIDKIILGGIILTLTSGLFLTVYKREMFKELMQVYFKKRLVK